MNDDLLIVPAKLDNAEDHSEYDEVLPTSPPWAIRGTTRERSRADHGAEWPALSSSGRGQARYSTSRAARKLS
jgi:hypothetical protein